MGQMIAETDPCIRVCAMDDRPEFRRTDLI